MKRKYHTKKQSTNTRITEMDLQLHMELNPPPQFVRKDKKWRPHPRPGALTRRGPRRPYRRVPAQKIDDRIQYWKDVLDASKQKVQVILIIIKYLIIHYLTYIRQHEQARTMLNRYVNEKTYRQTESMSSEHLITEKDGSYLDV